MTTMLETIQELLDGRSAPTLASLEDTLTTGYAHALELEGERLRLEQRLRELIRAQARAHEIADVSDRLGEADGRLRHLRAMLATLRKHVYDPCVAAGPAREVARRSRS